MAWKFCTFGSWCW
uniref:Uncharacterized protein n=1 Tax=Arundo donax TaxID=35708 RepID=A0A0A9BWE3_ARUDO